MITVESCLKNQLVNMGLSLEDATLVLVDFKRSYETFGFWSSQCDDVPLDLAKEELEKFAIEWVCKRDESARHIVDKPKRRVKI